MGRHTKTYRFWNSASWLKWKWFCFVFGRYPARIKVATPLILSHVSDGFPPSLQANIYVAPRMWPRLLVSTSYPICYALSSNHSTLYTEGVIKPHENPHWNTRANCNHATLQDRQHPHNDNILYSHTSCCSRLQGRRKYLGHVTFGRR
jgi:hypothetical protein